MCLLKKSEKRKSIIKLPASPTKIITTTNELLPPNNDKNKIIQNFTKPK